MARGMHFGFLFATLVLLPVCSVKALLLKEQRRNGEVNQELSKAILEMLHIQKVSASYQAKPHPYMKTIYQHLEALEAQDFGGSNGILVQSFRSVDGSHPQGWIWFNISNLNPSMLGAELVLYRKTLHSRPLSVTVTLHGITASHHNLNEIPALDERQLTLDQRPSSGYDVFNVSAVLAEQAVEAVGFQLRYTDESGSLVLHEALTQSLYSLNRDSLQEPLLVLYRASPLHF